MDNNFNNGKGTSLLSKIMGALFLVIFFGAIVAIIYFKDKNETMCAFIFGVVFFVIGIYIIMFGGINKKNFYILIFPIVGAGIMIFSGGYMWGNDYIKSHIMALIPAALLSVFILVGIAITAGTFINNLSQKLHCTESITAVCINLNRRHDSDSGSVYAPVYKYYYGGEEYIVAQDFYTNIDVPKIDSKVELYINPENPEEFYRKSFLQNLVKYGLGIIFLTCGTAALIAYIQNIK